MKKLRLALVMITLVLSTSGIAATYTVGTLTSDDTTNYIMDTATGRKYLRFDLLNNDFGVTLIATMEGGKFSEWSIASSVEAYDFYSAAISGVSTPCRTDAPPSGPDVYSCTALSEGGNWFSEFGGETGNYDDGVWFTRNPIDYSLTLEESYRSAYYEEFGSLKYGGVISFDPFNFPNGDWVNEYSSGNPLVYLDPAAVPVPAAVWLFGSGLIGLIGFARKSK